MDVHQIAKALGRMGGQARSKRLSGAEKKKIASLGGKCRAESFIAAKRIKENFRYVIAMCQLNGELPKVNRAKSFKDRLPGIYQGPND